MFGSAAGDDEADCGRAAGSDGDLPRVAVGRLALRRKREQHDVGTVREVMERRDAAVSLDAIRTSSARARALDLYRKTERAGTGSGRRDTYGEDSSGFLSGCLGRATARERQKRGGERV